jgi:hypothetical protein
VKYPVQGKPGKHRKIKRRETIAHEAHGLANRLLGRDDLPRVVETRRIWDEPKGQPPSDDLMDEPEESQDADPKPPEDEEPEAC